ncbi:TIGR01777 family oxidoreductase [Thermodesulfobacteriota bacterium]
MRVFMTGGTGFVGKKVAETLAMKGHEITVLTRRIRSTPSVKEGMSFLEGNPTEPGDWQGEVPGHDVVINLAGASIFTRWTKSSKKKILDSRVLTTRNLVSALNQKEGTGPLFLSTSAIGYYGFHGDEKLDEAGSAGEDFLASLAQEWEAAALEAEAFCARVVLLRFGIVLGRGGGALKQMVPVFKWYLGSPLGSGKQWFSWIHEQDLVDLYLFLIEQEEIAGPVNCTAPYPVRNREFTGALGAALGKPTFMPAVPGFVMKIAMGEFGTMLLNGQRVMPAILLEKGFHFRFPKIKEALNDLVR